MWKRNMTGIGFAGAQATALVGSMDTGVTSTGSSSQADSYAIRAENTVVSTTAANTGVRLPSFLTAGDSGIIANDGASTLFVYPPTGGKINNGSADAKVDVATAKVAYYVCKNSIDFAIVVGA